MPDASDAEWAQYAHSMGPDAGLAPARVEHPTTLEQVQALVRACAQTGQPLYPISRGCNWGYGEKSPLRPGAVVLDLSKMNRIVEVDEELAWVVLEPGVSQAQLQRHLAEHHPGLWMDATGAGGEASVVGNVLERGFGHTPYGDRFRNVCGLEVVLASGEVVRTGFHGYGARGAAQVYPYGVGPCLDGLFTQSNLGVVTRMTLWLMPRPKSMAAFFISFEDGRDLAEGVGALTRLKLDGTLRSVLHLGNDLRAIASSLRSAGAQGRLTDERRARLREEFGVARWNATGAVYGTPAQVRDALWRVRWALRGRKMRVMTPWLLRAVQWLPFKFPWLGPLGVVMDLLQGRVPELPKEAMYWGVAPGQEAHAGLLWVAPICAARAADVEAMVGLIEGTLAEFGFDALMSMNYVQDRALCAVTQLAFSRERPEDLERARACHHALLTRLLQAGFPPYRVHPLGVSHLHAQNPALWALAKQLKGALDPRSILAPGKNGL